MKKLLLASMTLSVIGVASQTAAGPIHLPTATGIVGETYRLIAAAPSGGGGDEASFVNEVLGRPLTNEEIDNFKIENLNDSNLVLDCARNENAFILSDDGGCFLDKTGLSAGGYDNSSFENLPPSFWATVILGETYKNAVGHSDIRPPWSSVDGLVSISINLQDIPSTSHIASAGGDAPPQASVPEPATMLFFGACTAGLAAARRRK